MSDWYYARTVNGQTEAVGPYDDASLDSMFRGGLLSSDTLVYHQTRSPDWTPISQAMAAVQQATIPQNTVVTINTNPPTIQGYSPRRIAHRRRREVTGVHLTFSPGMIIAIVGCVVVLVIAGKIGLDEYRLMRAKQEVGKVFEDIQEKLGRQAGITEQIRVEAIKHANAYIKRKGFQQLSTDTTVTRDHSYDLITVEGHAQNGAKVSKILLGFKVINWENRQTWEMKFAAIDGEIIHQASELEERGY